MLLALHRPGKGEEKRASCEGRRIAGEENGALVLTELTQMCCVDDFNKFCMPGWAMTCFIGQEIEAQKFDDFPQIEVKGEARN